MLKMKPVQFTAAVLIALQALILSLPAGARSKPGREAFGKPGQFDLYVLSLSWSPAFCATPAGKGPSNIENCSLGSDFVLHGLWPQNESGRNPEFCTRTGPVRPQDASPVFTGRIPVMAGNYGLLNHEWSKHGTCSGLNQAEYFKTTALAAARINVPKEFEQLESPIEESSETIEALFSAANPGLAPEMMVAKFKNGVFYELIICMDKKLAFTTCKNVREFPPGMRGVIFPPAAPARTN